MTLTKSFLILCAFSASSVCFAQTQAPLPNQSPAQNTSTQTTQWQHPHRDINPALREAFKACRESTPKQATGRPERGAMRSCLQSKGFTPPEHAHQAIDPALKAALKDCRESNPKQADGHANRDAMRSCLQSKGFSPPERHKGHRHQGFQQSNPAQ